MNIFRKLFGGKKSNAPAPAAPPVAPAPSPKATEPASNDLATDPNLIRVYDNYGREVLITRQQWRDNVLTGNLQKAWNNPDELYSLIVAALNDGFRSDVVAAAKHLYDIDPIPARGACLWGVVLREEDRLSEAEKVFQNFIDTHGEDGVILGNLAQVHVKRGDSAKGEQLLWHSLEIDPNQESGMGWYWTLYRDRSGEAAGFEALRRIADLPGSWRAQIWLARDALASGQLAQALHYYQESLSRAGKPAPADLLMQMSGDLGNRGYLADLLRLTAPHFDATAHGLMVGNNLIKAHVDLGQLQEARQLVECLYSQKRPDWRETLQFWETEIAKKDIALSPPPPTTPPHVTMLSVEGPIWLRHDSPAVSLFRPTDQAPWICFLGSSVDKGGTGEGIQRQMSDAAGRISRVLPLFLAEQTEIHTRSRARTLIPWMMQPQGGFALFSSPLDDDQAAHAARTGDEPADYLVLTHLTATANTWKARLRLIRTIDNTCLAEWIQAFHPDNPQDAFASLVSHLHAALRDHAGVLPRPSASAYDVPRDVLFTHYLLRMEQLLAARCGGVDGVAPGFLHGEREMMDGNLALCLECPQNITVRVLLAQTATAMKRVRPDVVQEYKEKLAQLQTEKPLPEPAQGIVQRILDEATAA